MPEAKVRNLETIKCSTCKHCVPISLESGGFGGAVCDLTKNKCFIGDTNRSPTWCPLKPK